MSLTIPQIISTIKDKKLRIGIIIIIFIIILLRYISFYNTPMWSKFFEYKTIMSL